MNLIPNIPPKAFSGSAIIIGYLLIDDLTANEQNALGNWLMLVAQVLSTNAFYQQVMTERKLKNSNQKENNNNYNNTEETNTIQILEKMVKALEKELENLKSQM